MWEGAILITADKSIISRLISWGQSLEGLPVDFIPSHVGIVEYYDPKERDLGLLWEATIGGVQISPISKYVGKSKKTILACPKLTEVQIDGILEWAEKFEGKEYGYIDLLIYLVDLVGFRLGLRRGWLTDRLNTKRFLVCSEYVGYCYGRGAHIRFYDKDFRWIKPSSLTPADIWREALRGGWEIKQIS